MKKILLSAAALCLLSTAPAYAQLAVQLNLGQPAYAVAAPVYVSPYPSYYDPGHRRHDYAYWQGQHARGPAVQERGHQERR